MPVRFVDMSSRENDGNTIARPSSRLWIGAPALMVLTCVTAHACAENPEGLDDAALRDCVVDLDWVIKGGATHSADKARWVLARRAAFLIAALDRLRAAPIGTTLASSEVREIAPVFPELPPRRTRDLDPARSNHQHSAP